MPGNRGKGKAKGKSKDDDTEVPVMSGKIWTFSQVIGSIGGSNLSTDPDPNTTPPDASRIIRVRAISLSPTLLGIVVDPTGATATVQLYIKEPNLQRWIPWNATLSLVTTSPGRANINQFDFADAFLRINTVSSAKCIGWYVS